MPNEIPETEVRGSLLVDIPRAEKNKTRVPVVSLCIAVAF